MIKNTQNITVENLEAYFKVIKPLLITKRPDPEKVKPFTSEAYQSFFSVFRINYQKNFTSGAEINVWQQSGLKRDEVRNTGVLAWWLDQQGNHGLGRLLFDAFIDVLNAVNLNNDTLKCEGDYATYVESLPLAELENRIDVEIVGKQFLLFIEVKIDASEGEQQLARYLKLLSNKAKHHKIKNTALIYLTINNKTFSTERGIYSASWSQVAQALLSIQLPKTAVHAQSLLHQFCRHIQEF